MIRAITTSDFVKEYKRDREAYQAYTRKQFKVKQTIRTYNQFLVWMNLNRSSETKIIGH